jgi:hypothetical protein
MPKIRFPCAPEAVGRLRAKFSLMGLDVGARLATFFGPHGGTALVETPVVDAAQQHFEKFSQQDAEGA